MMEHRASDPSEVKIQFSRQVPIEWVAGGAITVLLAICVWAYNISTSQRDTSRDVVVMKDDLKEIRAQGAATLTKITEGVIKAQRTEDRLADLERRVNTMEVKQGAK